MHPDAPITPATPRPDEPPDHPAFVSALPSSGAGAALVVVLAGLTTYLTQWLAVLLWIPPTQLTTMWLQGGTMLACFLLTSRSLWIPLAIAMGGGQAAYFINTGLASTGASLLLGVLSISTTVSAAAVLRHQLPGRLQLSTLREFLVYLLLGVVASALLATTLFTASVAVTGVREASFELWRTFAFSAALGFLVVTPVIVLGIQGARQIARDWRRRWVEAMMIWLLLALSVASLAFPIGASTWPVLALMLPPVMLWTAVRFGPLGAGTALLCVALISTWSTGQGQGPFVGQTAAVNTLSLQLYILGFGVPVLGLAVVLGEERRVTAELTATHEHVIQLNRDLISAREEEATRIARELHDDVGQQLALIAIGLSSVRRRHGDPESAPAAEDISTLQRQMKAVVRSVRDLSHRLHPSALEHVGLSTALQMQCEELRQVTGLEPHLVDESGDIRLPSEVRVCLFRVAQEAIANVVRHAQARRVELTLRVEDQVIRFKVHDDGRGFTPGETNGLGLHSISERVRLLGGTMRLDSAPGAGTTLRVAIPFREVAGA